MCLQTCSVCFKGNAANCLVLLFCMQTTNWFSFTSNQRKSSACSILKPKRGRNQNALRTEKPNHHEDRGTKLFLGRRNQTIFRTEEPNCSWYRETIPFLGQINPIEKIKLFFSHFTSHIIFRVFYSLRKTENVCNLDSVAFYSNLCITICRVRR